MSMGKDLLFSGFFLIEGKKYKSENARQWKCIILVSTINGSKYLSESNLNYKIYLITN